MGKQPEYQCSRDQPSTSLSDYRSVLNYTHTLWHTYMVICTSYSHACARNFEVGRIEQATSENIYRYLWYIMATGNKTGSKQHFLSGNPWSGYAYWRDTISPVLTDAHPFGDRSAGHGQWSFWWHKIPCQHSDVSPFLLLSDSASCNKIVFASFGCWRRQAWQL